MRISFFITICILLLTNCEDECENDNVKLGDISFADETLSFLNYSEDETINFESESGEFKEFAVELQESNNPRLCVTVLCRPSFEIDGLNGCEFYDSEDRYYILNSEDLSLHLRAGIETYIPETELFYDYVEIGIKEEELDSVFAGLVTSSNFTTPTIDTLSTILTAELSFMENDTLGGFQDVWVYQMEDQEEDEEDDEIFLILDEMKGIIQYKYKGEIWTLVE